jgi:arylsulfatase A-like enzyme
MRGRREERLLTRYWAVASQWESEEQFFPARVFGAAMCWLQENDGVEPFFLLVDSFDPHEPWYVPKQYAELYDPGYRGTEMIMPLYGPATYLTEQELANMRARYAANVTFVDAWLGRFLEALRAKGLLDKTLVIVTSDHGHLLGEHGVTGKLPQALYPELTHVPLIVRHPHGHGAGKRFDAFVGDHDVVPTILSAANLEPPYPLEGQPLQRLVDGTAKHRDHALTAMGSIRGTFVWVCDGQYALIVRANGEQARLFRVTDDPGHFHDLAKDRMNVVRRLYELALADAGGTIYKAVEDIKPGAVPYAGA